MARKKVHHRGAILAGVGLLAAATVAGGRFLYGKSGAKHRKKLADAV
jgi:hypothetical protein